MRDKIVSLCAAVSISLSSACWLNSSFKSKYERWYEREHAKLYEEQVIRDYAKEVSGDCKSNLAPWRVAVVMVDMQDNFLDVSPNLGEVLQKHMGVLDYCIENDIPMVVLETGPGKPVSLLEDRVNKLPRKVYVSKPTTGGFRGTVLKEQLRCYGAERIFLMGVYASDCVLDTAKGAINAGFDVAISNDTVFDQMFVKILLPEHVKAATEWYKDNTEVFDSYKDFFEGLADEESKNQ